MNFNEYLPSDLLERFEFANYNHALEIITQSFPSEWKEIEECLKKLSISVSDIREQGGNETNIPKKFDEVLYPFGWREIRISGDLHIMLFPRRKDQRGRFADEPSEEKVIRGYIDGHNIDFLKNRVAFDLEWNSKDQTFDRDVLAMRTYYDCDIISVGVIITRAEELNDVFKTVCDSNGKPIMKKYGASTTWMGKLIPRLDSRRNDEIVPIIEKCSSGPYIELFARGTRPGWTMWGNQASADYEPSWNTYKNHTVSNAEMMVGENNGGYDSGN